MHKYLLMLALLLASTKYTYAQISAVEKDSLYLHKVENNSEPDKVLHAEPLYIDLIRDLGARKGEREWNIGLGLTDKLSIDSYEALIEYEWAPIDRLGLEIELPFTYYAPLASSRSEEIPKNKLNSFKLAAQWSFYVNEKTATSLAFGYINELEFLDIQLNLHGNVFNPFLVVAKRWGGNFHSLLYTGPRIQQQFKPAPLTVAYDVNTSFHYMISSTKNFIGVEFNKTWEGTDFDLSIRPQMRLLIADNLMIGIVAGIPIARENERLSSFIRLIWEPPHSSH